MQELFEAEQRYFEEHIEGSTELSARMEGDLHYVQAGEPGKPVLVFIHGTPGDWKFAARYLVERRLLDKAQMVAIDRPGWGASRSAASGVIALGFPEQARRIAPVLAQLKKTGDGQPIILVGHSLGASLAPQLALDYPQLVDAMVLVAGALDPDLGKPRWYNLAASMGVVSWFLGPEMRQANREIMPLHGELTTLAERLGDIELPVTIIQGMRDRLVDPENADYAAQELANADLEIIRLEGTGHLIPWQQRELLVAELLTFLQRIEGRR